LSGQDPAHADAERPVPGLGADQERGRGRAGLIAQHLGIGDARGVIDGDVDVVPARPSTTAPAVTGDAMAMEAADLTQLLHVQMQEVARPAVLIAVLPFVEARAASAVRGPRA
jgi:hypothetical protein